MNGSYKDLAFSAAIEDEGRSLGIGVQKPAPNQAVLLRSKRSWWWCDAIESLKDLAFNAVVEDEGRPLGVGVQKPASKQAGLLWFKRSWW